MFIHLSVDGHLGCIHSLAIMDNAARDMGGQIPFQDPASTALGYIPRSGVAGSYGTPVFNYLRNQGKVSF